MCILVHAVKRQPKELGLEGQISNALVEVGPSITLASLSEVLAFAVGGFISMPACRIFSMFAGEIVIIDVLRDLTRKLLFGDHFVLWTYSFGCSIGLPSASYCFRCIDSF